MIQLSSCVALGNLLHLSSLSVLLSLMAAHKELLRIKDLMYLQIPNSLIHASFLGSKDSFVVFLKEYVFKFFFFNAQYLKNEKVEKKMVKISVILFCAI